MSSKRRRGPSNPQEILARRLEREATQRAEARRVERIPENWGVSAEILSMPAAEDITAIVGARGRIVHARRSDPFDLLHAAGGLTDDQHLAASRLFRDYCIRSGVRDHDRLVLDRVDDGGRPQLVNDAMIAAGERIRACLQGVGPVNAKLLRALIEPLVLGGEVRVWRVVVQLVTGETERHAQGAAVRLACEALRLVMGIGSKPEQRAAAGVA